jgi:Transposase IS4
MDQTILEISDEELLHILGDAEEAIDDVELPLDNSEDTDTEDNEKNDSTVEIIRTSLHRARTNSAENEITVTETEEGPDDPADAVEDGEGNRGAKRRGRPGRNDSDRKWLTNVDKQTSIPPYNDDSKDWAVHFGECSTALDVFVTLLGDVTKDIVFQSNLYATQKGKTLCLSDKELLSFIGINFFMGYHVLPNLSSYWCTDEDLCVPTVSKVMPKNRFYEVLSNIHLNDNSLIPRNNTDKLYKVRPLLEGLNRQFGILYTGTRVLSVDESMIRFKGRSSIKQYNPMKPIKRGFKIWCLADMMGFVKKFDIYQGRNEALKEKYEGYQLGERIVLELLEGELGKNKIVYFDNFYTTVNLLEKLLAEKTLACGTIRKRIGNPANLTPDKSMKRGDVDMRISNTNVTFYKWMDNRIVQIASNFHGNEKSRVKRRLKDGKSIMVWCPSSVVDYKQRYGWSGLP